METKPTTISKVIAFELGLLIAVLTWIAFAGIPGMKPRPVAEAEEPADASFANVSPIYQATQLDVKHRSITRPTIPGGTSSRAVSRYHGADLRSGTDGRRL